MQRAADIRARHRFVCSGMDRTGGWVPAGGGLDWFWRLALCRLRRAMSAEHTVRTGADKGDRIIVPEDACATRNAEWHHASIGYALQNVAMVTDCDRVIAALRK